MRKDLKELYPSYDKNSIVAGKMLKLSDTAFVRHVSRTPSCQETHLEFGIVTPVCSHRQCKCAMPW